MYTKAQQLGKTPKAEVKKKKPNRKALEKKLDDVASEICRFQGHCTTCEKKNCVFNAHHFKSRKYKGVRWYLPNLICLCVHCHVFSFTFSAHKTPELFKEKMISLNGQKWADDIEDRSITHTHWSDDQLETMLSELQEHLRLLKASVV